MKLSNQVIGALSLTPDEQARLRSVLQKHLERIIDQEELNHTVKETEFGTQILVDVDETKLAEEFYGEASSALDSADRGFMASEIAKSDPLLATGRYLLSAVMAGGEYNLSIMTPNSNEKKRLVPISGIYKKRPYKTL